MRRRTVPRPPLRQPTFNEVQQLWLANIDGWYARAVDSRTQEQMFSLLDQLQAFERAEIDTDFHIKQGFGIDEQGKDTLLKAWEADRKPE